MLPLIYSEAKMERLYQAALRVLRETGFRLQHDGFLKRFEERGMRVDWAGQRVHITEALVNEILAPAPGKGQGLPVPVWLPTGFGLSGSYPRYYDWATRSSRPGTSALLLDLLRGFSALRECECVGRILTLSDVPPALEPIVATALTIKHSPRPVGGEVYQASSIPYLVELGEIATGRPQCPDYVAGCTFIVPPLKMTHAEAELIMAKAKLDLPATAGTMPSSGATAPVTREGTIVIELAEVIAIWLCYRLLNPALRLDAICASSSFDMQHGTCCFSSAEAVLQDCATVQILRHIFGVSGFCASSYVDAKVPGIQATYEKLFKAFWSYRFQGYAALGCGLLEAGQAFSPAQALLDWDMWRTCNAIVRAAPAVEDEVPFEDIARAVETNGSFLGTDHTLRLFRDVLQMPELLDRSPRRLDPEETQKAAGIMDRAQEQYEALRRAAPEYRAPADICRAVDRVVERARRDLLAGVAGAAPVA